MIPYTELFYLAQKKQNIPPVKEVKITLPTNEEIDISNRILSIGNVTKELEGKDLNESRSDDVVLTFKNDDGYFSNVEGTGIFDIHDDIVVRIKYGILGIDDRVKVFSGKIDSGLIDGKGRTQVTVTCFGWEKDCEKYNAEGIGNPNGDPLYNITGLDLEKTVYNGQIGVRSLKFHYVDNAGNDTLQFAKGEPVELTLSYQKIYDKRGVQYIRAKAIAYVDLPDEDEEDEIVVVDDEGTLKAGDYYRYKKLHFLISKTFDYMGVTNQDIKIKPIVIPSGERIFNYLDPLSSNEKVYAQEIWEIVDDPGVVKMFVGVKDNLYICEINLNNGTSSWTNIATISIGTEKHITRIIYSGESPERLYVFSGYDHPSWFGAFGGAIKLWGCEGLTVFDRDGPSEWNKVYDVLIGDSANKEMVLVDSILDTRIFGSGDKLYWTYLEDDYLNRTTLRFQRIDADTGSNLTTVFTATPAGDESCTPRAPGSYGEEILSYKIPWARYTPPSQIDRKITKYVIPTQQATTIDDPFQLFGQSMFAATRKATGLRCIDYFYYCANPTYYGRYRLCTTMSGPYDKATPDLEYSGQDIKPNFCNGYHFDYVKEGVFTGWSDRHIYIQWGKDNIQFVSTEICENQVDVDYYPYAAPLPIQWDGRELFVGVLNTSGYIVPFLYMPLQMGYIEKAKTKGYKVNKFLNELAKPFLCLWKRPDKNEGIFYYRDYWRGEMTIEANQYKQGLKKGRWKHFFDGIVITDEETGKEWSYGDLGFGKRIHSYKSRFVYDSYGNVLVGWNYNFFNRKRDYWLPMTKYLIQIEPFDKIYIKLIDKSKNLIRIAETFVQKVIINDYSKLVELKLLERYGQPYHKPQIAWDVFVK